MRLRSVIVFISGLALLGTARAGAQELELRSMDVLRAQLDLDKKAVVEDNLILTDEQSAAFWPIYDEYQRELRAIDERVVRIVNEYSAAYVDGSITPATARRLLDESIEADDDEVELRKRYAERLMKVIPPIEAARYLQIERKIRAVVEFDLSDRIPLVE